MNPEFNLENYLNEGIQTIIKNAVRASLKNPKESLFIARFAYACKEAALLRNQQEKEEVHIPPFLICSITDQKGRYMYFFFFLLVS